MDRIVSQCSCSAAAAGQLVARNHGPARQRADGHDGRLRACITRSWLLQAAVLLLTLLTIQAATVQLPAGTTDTTQAPAQDFRRAQAAEALDKQDFPNAQKLLTQLTAQTPDATLLYDLGFTDEALNDEFAAAIAYQRAIAASSTYFEPHLALGLLLARTGKAAEARTELTTATTLQTSDNALKARAFRALARLNQATDPAAASNDLLEALKLSHESVDDALLAGELAEAAHDPTAAEAAYRRILATHSNDPAITAALAHLLLTLKRAPEVEALLTTALAAHPANPTLSSQLAAAYAAQGKGEEAIALIEKLHATAPTDDNLTRLLAHLYTDSKQPEKALPLYAQLLTQFPHDAPLLADEGDTLLRLHNYPEAERVLKLAVADPHAFAKPDDYGATAENLAFAASHNNDPQTVLQALSQRATVLPQSPASLFLAATAHDTLHQPKEASALYKDFLAAAAGKFPDEEWEARHRLIALEHRK